MSLKHMPTDQIEDLKQVGGIITWVMTVPGAPPTQARMIAGTKEQDYEADVSIKVDGEWREIGKVCPQDRGSYRAWLYSGCTDLHYTKISAAWFCAQQFIKSELAQAPPRADVPTRRRRTGTTPVAAHDRDEERRKLMEVVREGTQVLSRALDQLLKASPEGEELPTGTKRISTREVPAQNA